MNLDGGFIMEKKILSIEERITKIKADSIKNKMEVVISEKTFINLDHLDIINGKYKKAGYTCFFYTQFD